MNTAIAAADKPTNAKMPPQYCGSTLKNCIKNHLPVQSDRQVDFFLLHCRSR